MIRKSLDLRSWEAAQKFIREWETNPNAVVTVKEACGKFVKEQEDRNLSEAFLRKLRNVTKELKETFGSVSLRSVTVDELRELKQGWKLALITKQKRIEMMRSFFEFCIVSGWMERNPAKAIKLRGVAVRPTLPFEEEQMEQILWSCEVIRDTHPAMKPGIEKKLRALVLLMRYSGLRISDAVILTEDRIRDGKLFLYHSPKL